MRLKRVFIGLTRHFRDSNNSKFLLKLNFVNLANFRQFEGTNFRKIDQKSRNLRSFILPKNNAFKILFLFTSENDPCSVDIQYFRNQNMI